MLEHSELQGREKTIHLSKKYLIKNFKAGRTDHPFELQKVQVIASPGAPLFKLRQSLESGALEGGESTPHSTQGHSGEYLKPSVCSEWLK